MKRFSSLVEALDDLRARGFSADFDLQPDSLECAVLDLKLHPDDFEIVEVYRFEGANDPDDSSVLYAIEGKNGSKGVLIDAYGAYATAASAAMLTKLQVKHDSL